MTTTIRLALRCAAVLRKRGRLAGPGRTVVGSRDESVDWTAGDRPSDRRGFVPSLLGQRANVVHPGWARTPALPARRSSSSRFSRQITPLVLAVALGIVIASCASAPAAPLAPAEIPPTPTLRPISLPADDNPHDVLTEWWYYTGHLVGPANRHYGFEFVFFQSTHVGAPVGYAAHFAMTDDNRKTFQFDQRVATQPAIFPRFALSIGDWSMGSRPGEATPNATLNATLNVNPNGTGDRLAATMEGYAIDLTTTPRKPPVLHGGNGIISFGPAGDSYYYSETRLGVGGQIVDHGTTISVTGEAWKDRQWGNFIVAPGGGWDWFSVQLDDDTELMLFILRGPQAPQANGVSTVSPAYGTFVRSDGTSVTLGPGVATVRATGRWHSPTSGADYPSGWTIDLPDRELHLRLTPTVLDQELDARQSSGNIYWEGEVTIDGTSGGNSVAGRGYVELTGYAPASTTNR